MNRLSSFSTKHPKSIVIAWVVVLAISVLFALRLDGALSAGGFTDPRAEAILTQQTLEEAFDEAPNQVVVAVESDTAIEAAALRGVTDELRASGATTVRSPSDNADWLSPDGTVAVIVAGFPGDNTAVQNLMPELQADLDALPGTRVYVTGQPSLDYQLNVHSKEDATRAELIVVPILLLVLLVVFRSVTATLVPLLMAGSALGISSAFGYLATRVTEISILYSNIVSMIGLAVAVDYSLFIIKRYREERANGLTDEEALALTYRTAGKSVLFSGIAVAVALVALLIPGLMAFTSIALGGIVVTVVALLLSMTVLPAALILLGPRIDFGTIRFRARRRPVTAAVHRAPARTQWAGLAGIIALLIVSVPVLGLSLQSPVASATILPSDDPARVGLTTIEDNVGHRGLFPIQLVVSAPADAEPGDVVDAVDALTTFALRQDGVSEVTSVSTLGLSAAEVSATVASATIDPALSVLWSQTGDGIVTRIVVDASAGPDSALAHDLVREFRSQGPQILPASFALGVTGATAQGVDFDLTLVQSIPWIVGLVFILTFIMLAIAFRSMMLPALALGFNTLVVAASLGILAMFVRGFGGGQMNSVTPVLLFAVMFGLSMDYMVIIMSRITEAYHGGLSFPSAVGVGVERTRSMINSAAVIMVAVFTSFASAQISIVREIGIGLSVAVILDALVIRMVVMPAVLRAIGPRSLGAASRRLHERVRPSPTDAEGADDRPGERVTALMI